MEDLATKGTIGIYVGVVLHVVRMNHGLVGF